MIQFPWSLQFGQLLSQSYNLKSMKTSNYKLETIKNESYTKFSYFLQLTCKIHTGNFIFDYSQKFRLKKSSLKMQSNNFFFKCNRYF